MGYNAENLNTKVWCIACFLENVQTEKRKRSNWRVSAGPTANILHQSDIQLLSQWHNPLLLSIWQQCMRMT